MMHKLFTRIRFESVGRSQESEARIQELGVSLMLWIRGPELEQQKKI